MGCGTYGSANYSEIYYGGICFIEEPDEGVLTWKFEVDWDGDTTFTDEGGRMQDFKLRRGRNYLVSSSGNGYTHYSPGEATALLDNADGRYDYFNSSSPIYPDVTPGKFVRISVVGDVNTYEIMRGRIESIQPIIQDGQRKVLVTVVDGLGYLKNIEANTDFLSAKQADNIAIDEVLDAVDWPSTEWPLGSTSSTAKQVPIFWSWDKRALDVLNDLADATAGVFFHARDGTAYFADGANLFVDTSVLVEEEKILRDILIRSPWEQIFNDIRISVAPQILVGDPGVASWELGQSVDIESGQAVDIEAVFEYDNQPAAHTASFDITDVNYTSSPNGSLNVSLVGKRSGGAIIRFENPHATTETLDTADIDTNQELYYVPHTNKARSSDATSQSDFGTRTFTLKLASIQETLYALEMAAYLLGRWKDPTIYPTIKVEARPWLQYTPEIFLSRFLLSIPAYNISQVYRIGQIEHEWKNQNGQSVVTTFTLEPYVDPFTFTGS